MIDISPFLAGLGTGAATLAGKRLLEYIFSKDEEGELNKKEEIAGDFQDQVDQITRTVLNNVESPEEAPRSLDGFETYVEIGESKKIKYFKYEGEDIYQYEKEFIEENRT